MGQEQRRKQMFITVLNSLPTEKKAKLVEGILESLPAEEKAKLKELRKDANHAAASFARGMIANLLRYHEITKEKAIVLLRWTYCWM